MLVFAWHAFPFGTVFSLHGLMATPHHNPLILLLIQQL